MTVKLRLSDVDLPEITGPLTVHSSNSTYLSTPAGRAQVLVGPHTWDALQDWGFGGDLFDFAGYLDLLERHGCNHFRLWHWEGPKLSFLGVTPNTDIEPLPWLRKSNGKFDLFRFEDAYFDRLRERAELALARNIYVTVMLFQEYVDWNTHPLNGANNDSGINAGRTELHSLNASNAVLGRQEAYVNEVISRLDDLPNVLYEVCNELTAKSLGWQKEVRRWVNARSDHLVNANTGFGSGGSSFEDLLTLGTDMVSFPWAGNSFDFSTPGFRDEGLPIVDDSDHQNHWLFTSGRRKRRDAVWISFFLGGQAWQMEATQNELPGFDDLTVDNQSYKAGRDAMGFVHAWVQRLKLEKFVAGDHSSTGYCLCRVKNKKRGELLIYKPNGIRNVTVDLGGLNGDLAVEWMRCTTGRIEVEDETVDGGGSVELRSPWKNETVLYLADTRVDGNDWPAGWVS